MQSLGNRPSMAGALQWLVREGKADTFVESGTGKGDDILWAGRIFPCAYTIEIDPVTFKSFYFRRFFRFQRGKIKNADLPITEVLGDSRTVLPETVLPKISGRKPVFWLDAHSVSIPYGSPVLEELSLLREWGQPCVILIDDYALFSLQPKDKKEQMGWPYVLEIFQALTGLSVSTCDDIIVAVHPSICTARELIYANFPHRMEVSDI